MQQINSVNNHWEKIIDIRMSLKELQYLYDCVGMSTINMIEETWKIREKEPPYQDINIMGNTIYEQLNKLIVKNQGEQD